MEARIKDRSEAHDLFGSYIEDQILQRQFLNDLKHEIYDLRKDIKHELSELNLSTESALKQSIKDLEMRMYHFITKTVMAAVAVLGGLQSFFHFIK